MRIVKAGAAFLGVTLAGLALWLWLSPPALLRVGDGYAAKIVCSNVFLAGRDAQAVLSEDVQAPGNPLLRLVRVSVDREKGRVTARIAGLFAAGHALYRPGYGCASVPDGDFDAAALAPPPRQAIPPASVDLPWPGGEAVAPAEPQILNLLADPDLIGPAMRAIVIVKGGRIVAEAYGPGFSAETPLLGWSMAKTVNAALIGRMMMEGRLSLDDRNLFPAWAGDGRKDISVADLMAMQSGLAFNEAYGSVTDVTRMLYLEPDMAAFVVGRPLEAHPGTTFGYSSGDAVLLSRLWMDRLGTQKAALAYPVDSLFGPLGMHSAVFEPDARGTFVGSSYLYATARDWARFGQFLLQNGIWQGRPLLPERFMAALLEPAAQSGERYSQAQSWFAPPSMRGSKAAGLPADTIWLSGHDGQSMAVIPSADLVVVRLGLTPGWLRYRPEQLVKRILSLSGDAAQ